VEHVEGRAAVINNDLPAAEDEAIEDAKRRAVEDVVGVYVEQETLVQQAIVVDNFIRTRAGGYVENYLITKQPWVDEIGLCRVEITASVRPQIEGDLRREVSAEDSLVVVIPEFIDGQASAEPVVQNYLITALLEAGFRVKDATQLRNIQERDRALALARGAAQEAAEIGLRFLSGTVLTGRAEARLVDKGPWGTSFTRYSYTARATVRAVRTDTGDILLNTDVSGPRVIALDPQTAAQKALGEVLQQVGECVLAKMQERMGALKHAVQVDVDGLPDQKAFERFKNYLSAMRWVEQVESVQFSPQRSTFTIVYGPKTSILASRLALDKRCEVLDFSPNRVLCRYLAPPEEPKPEPSSGVSQSPPPLTS